MGKPSTHNPSGSLHPNGPLSPPLTPALNGNHHSNGSNNAMGIMDGTVDPNSASNLNPFHNARPASPNPSVSSSANTSPNPNSSRSSTSSPPQRPSSTFTSSTAYSPSTSQPHHPPTPDLPLPRRKETDPLPTHAIHYDSDSDHNPTTTTPPPPTRLTPKQRVYTDGRTDRAFPRLSKPVELLRSAYDVVVIGSGYGGGVAASRMARTGQSVCMLERGREKWPGEYPAGAVDSLKELHYSGQLAPGCGTGIKGVGVEGGDPTGLFHLVMGRGTSAVVGNGEFLLFFSFLFGFVVVRERGREGDDNG